MSSFSSPVRGGPSPRPFSLSDYLFEKRIAYVLIAPTLLGIVLVNVYPLIYTVVVSFQRYKITSPHGTWVGLENYAQILSSTSVLNSVRVSLEYTLGSVSFSIASTLPPRSPASCAVTSILAGAATAARSASTRPTKAAARCTCWT
ncbi:MAG TPA: hypothetical protein VKX96_10505 [Chloroflexota bacterium]|nr:hypothetical protein [Chloroflexota bacterium]